VITLLPPAPFPPQATERPGEVDLAVRLWDGFFTAAWLGGPARVRLEERLALAVDGASWERAAALLGCLLDCWPCAALIDGAREAWDEQRAPWALATLARVAELVRQAQAWDGLSAGPWCLPDAAWVRSQLPGAAAWLQRRCTADGAATLATALGIPLRGRPEDPEGLALVDAGDLPRCRAQLGAALARGRQRAVLLQGPLPPGPDAALALGEFRLEGSHQRVFEAFGLAGLQLEPDTPPAPWAASLTAPPAGRPGPVLRAKAAGRFLPGPAGALAQGRPQRVGFLLWEGPHPPLAVAPVAVAVLQSLDGQRDATAVAEALRGPVDQVQLIMDELIGLGAAERAEGAGA
jgi:hypothetical protein